MDINALRIAITLAALAAFLGVVWWAYAPGRKASLESQARSILEEEGT
jgi:cbb3-type cytochrome oxidase subunit 3